jgi:hypothetical protein
MEKQKLPMPKTLAELINTDPKIKVIYKEKAKKALKDNENLSLEEYDMYLKDFTQYAENLFDPEENIFVERRKEMSAERNANFTSVR